MLKTIEPLLKTKYSNINEIIEEEKQIVSFYRAKKDRYYKGGVDETQI